MKKKHLIHTAMMAAFLLLPSLLCTPVISASCFDGLTLPFPASCPDDPSLLLWAARAAAAAAGTQTGFSDIILLLKEDANAAQEDALFALLPSGCVLWHENGAALVRVPEVSGDFWLARLRAQTACAAADYDAPLLPLSISEDAYSDAQWGLHNTGSYSYIADMNTSTVLSTQDIDMNVPEAWELYSSLPSPSREVVVAVIDTGVDTRHPDLAANIWVNPGEIPGDGIDNDNNGYIDDTEGWDFYNGDNTVCHYAKDGIHTLESDNDDHGTHVAGIIAAVKDNGIGIAGVASCANIKIMPLKIHGGAKGSGTIANAVRAIRYATAMEADICNISWGTSKTNAALEEAIRQSDMLFICAAGNSGTNNNSAPVYPANYELGNVISVTFLDASGNLSRKSNYGTSTVDLAAPGIHIYSTCVGSYVSLSGSSMAAPHVTGVAALLYSFGENLYPSNIKEILTETRKPVASLEGKLKHAGIPDAFAALLSASALKRDYTAPVLSFQPGFSDNRLTLTVSASDIGGSGIRTISYAYGIRELSSFRRGTTDTPLAPGDTLSFAKAGDYTFYVSDYAGNERAVIYHLADDATAPKITAGYDVAYDRASFLVTVNVSDLQSGVRLARYAPGKQDVDYFLSGNQGIPLNPVDGACSFSVRDAGIYTIYATDNRGNKTVQTIDLHIVSATSMTMNASKKTLTVGDSFSLLPTLTPTETTDKIKYSTSKPTVCKVNSSGKITAVAPGRATITAKTSGGIQKKCVITVKAAK